MPASMPAERLLAVGFPDPLSLLEIVTDGLGSCLQGNLSEVVLFSTHPAAPTS